MIKKGWLLGAAIAALATAALAQAIVIPQVSSIGSSDLIQVIPNGQPGPGSQYASAPLLGNYGATLTGNNPENALIGGDATTNLWQRATTGASVTTTLTYGGPDRWAYWSGTNTAMTVSQSSTSGDIPTGYLYGFKMARTAAQTGVVQMCMMQVVESANSYAFAGQTAEISFHAATGANFSAANTSRLVVYMISGTAAGGSAATAAYSLNAGGGGSSLWTGQVSTGVNVSLQAVSTLARYGVAVPVPAGAAQLAVAICYTPVGTAGTNDYVTLSGIQLTRNNALTTFAGASGAALSPNDTRLKAFARRAQQVETSLQQRYYYRLTEATIYAAASSAAVPLAPCSAVDTTHTNCLINFPVVLRTAATMTYTAGFATPTSTTQATLGACSALAAAQTVSGAIPTIYGALANCTATTIPAAGVASFLYASSGTGVIQASAEF